MSDDEPRPHFSSVALAATETDEVEASTDGQKTGAITQTRQQRLDIGIRQGPLPAPEEMAAYEKACPGMGMQIVALAKAEQDNRHARDMIGRTTSATLAMRGQIFGASFIALLFAAGIVLFLKGIPIGGIISLGGSALSMGGAALSNRKKPPAPPAPPPAPPAPPQRAEPSTALVTLPKTTE